jgi:hypothetical protein
MAWRDDLLENQITNEWMRRVTGISTDKFDLDLLSDVARQVKLLQPKLRPASVSTGGPTTMFQARHYQAIADAIKESGILEMGGLDEQEWDLLYCLVDLFEKDNPNFKKDLFIKACM